MVCYEKDNVKKLTRRKNNINLIALNTTRLLQTIATRQQIATQILCID